MTETPILNLLETLDTSQTIGTVERFGTNNTRTVFVRSEKLLEWASFVHSENGSEWVEVAITPDAPMAAYPKGENEGVALAPGLYPEDFPDSKGEEE